MLIKGNKWQLMIIIQKIQHRIRKLKSSETLDTSDTSSALMSFILTDEPQYRSVSTIED